MCPNWARELSPEVTLWFKSRLQGQSQWGVLQSVWETISACKYFILLIVLQSTATSTGDAELAVTFILSLLEACSTKKPEGFSQCLCWNCAGFIQQHKKCSSGPDSVWEETLINNQDSSACRPPARFVTQELKLTFRQNMTGEKILKDPLRPTGCSVGSLC